MVFYKRPIDSYSLILRCSVPNIRNGQELQCQNCTKKVETKARINFEHFDKVIILSFKPFFLSRNSIKGSKDVCMPYTWYKKTSGNLQHVMIAILISIDILLNLVIRKKLCKETCMPMCWVGCFPRGKCENGFASFADNQCWVSKSQWLISYCAVCCKNESSLEPSKSDW